MRARVFDKQFSDGAQVLFSSTQKSTEFSFKRWMHEVGHLSRLLPLGRLGAGAAGSLRLLVWSLRLFSRNRFGRTNLATEICRCLIWSKSLEAIAERGSLRSSRSRRARRTRRGVGINQDRSLSSSRCSRSRHVAARRHGRKRRS